MNEQKKKSFGKINLIDLSFVMIVCAMGLGFFWVSKSGHSPLNKIIKARGIAEVTVAIRGVRTLDPGVFKEGEKAFLTIRNQRYAPVEVTKIKQSRRKVAFMNPQGQVVAVEDPTTPEVKDIDLTFKDQAEVTDEGIVMGGHHVKIGTTVELDAFGYRLNATIMYVKFNEQVR